MATVCTRGLLQLVFAQVCKALGEGVETQLFSRGEGDPWSTPPNSVVQLGQTQAQGGQGRSGGLCAPGADLGGGSLHPGGCGREARPHPSVEESSGWDAEGSGHWPSPLGS